MPPLATVDLEARPGGPGIDPDLLARRANLYYRAPLVPAAKLARWLVENRFAVETDGLLHPTPLGRQVGGMLTAIERDSAGNQ